MADVRLNAANDEWTIWTSLSTEACPDGSQFNGVLRLLALTSDVVQRLSTYA